MAMCMDTHTDTHIHTHIYVYNAYIYALRKIGHEYFLPGKHQDSIYCQYDSIKTFGRNLNQT